MYWSVHQYQRPMIGEHSSTPSHGVWLGSNRNPGKPCVAGVVDSGRHRCVVSGFAAISASNPPIFDRPTTSNTAEPVNSTGTCIASVHSTDFMPPRITKTPVTITRDSAENQKKSVCPNSGRSTVWYPRIVWMAKAPAKIVTDAFVSTYAHSTMIDGQVRVPGV